MNCPVCDEKLRPVEKYGVEIDICPGCKGVWLDRGELDKILEALNSGTVPTAEGPVAPPPLDPTAGPVPVGQVPVYPQAQPYPPAAPAYYAAPAPDSRRHHDDNDDDHDRHERGEYRREESGHGGSRRGQRGSWLGDLLGGLGGD